MNIDDVIEEIITDLASGLIDKSDDEIMEALSSYDLAPEDMTDVLDLVDAVREAESLNGQNIAQDMANEDNTEVSVTEEDSDGDGDMDKVTVEKDEPEDDEEFSDISDSEMAALKSLTSDEGDDPHDEGLAGETTLEEDLMMDPEMSPTDFSAKAAGKRGAKKGEPAPDMEEDLGTLSDSRMKNIVNTLSQYRW